MDSIEEAFRKVPRQNFLPADMRSRSNYDMPLPIGYEQTNSQPTTVQHMLEWLDVRLGQKVLDLGSGSGWTSALLSYLVGKDGHIVAVERIPQLVQFARQNLKSVNTNKVEVHQAAKILGWPDLAPYDRILVSAAGKEIPHALIDQLKNPGKMVIPVKNNIYEITKDSKGKVTRASHPGFVFVPLIT